MLERDFEEGVGYWIFTAAHALESALNEELAPLGITHRQVQILGALAIHGQAAQNELADLLRIEPSSIVRLIDRMERAGWVARTADPDDRRKKIVRPTEKAGPVWREIRTHGMRVKERATRNLSEERLLAARETLKTLRFNLTGETGSGCLPHKGVAAAP